MLCTLFTSDACAGAPVHLLSPVVVLVSRVVFLFRAPIIRHISNDRIFFNRAGWYLSSNKLYNFKITIYIELELELAITLHFKRTRLEIYHID